METEDKGDHSKLYQNRTGSVQGNLSQLESDLNALKEESQREKPAPSDTASQEDTTHEPDHSPPEGAAH